MFGEVRLVVSCARMLDIHDERLSSQGPRLAHFLCQQRDQKVPRNGALERRLLSLQPRSPCSVHLPGATCQFAPKVTLAGRPYLLGCIGSHLSMWKPSTGLRFHAAVMDSEWKFMSQCHTAAITPITQGQARYK